MRFEFELLSHLLSNDIISFVDSFFYTHTHTHLNWIGTLEAGVLDKSSSKSK